MRCERRRCMRWRGSRTRMPQYSSAATSMTSSRAWPSLQPLRWPTAAEPRTSTRPRWHSCGPSTIRARPTPAHAERPQRRSATSHTRASDRWSCLCSTIATSASSGRRSRALVRWEPRTGSSFRLCCRCSATARSRRRHERRSSDTERRSCRRWCTRSATSRSNSGSGVTSRPPWR